jgi:hypothetical protein
MFGWWFGTCFIFPYIGNSNPTPPHWYLIMKEQCLCLQDSKKDDEVAVSVCEHKNMNDINAPHPTGN